MKRSAIAILALVLTVVPATVASPQDAEQRALRSRVEGRYDIVPLTDGIALTPKNRTRDVRLIEISQGVISINGTPVSGRELRERLGEDAENVLRLSYLTTEQRRELFGGPGAKAAPRLESDSVGDQERSSDGRRRSGRERVRIFGDVTVNENEAINGQAVAVFGNVRVDGEVRQEAVAVLGSVTLGPKAVVGGDVVSVGGRVRRAEGARVEGSVTEVSFADSGMRLNVGPWFGPVQLFGAHDGFPRLIGSTFRMVLLALFAGIALVIARGSVERSAERVVDNPPKAMLVGLAAELLFLPVLILTAFVLVITLIGIPLLLLLPFAVLFLLLLALVGFSGTAYAIGQAARRRFGMSGQAAFFDVCLGLLVILSPLLIGRVVGLAGWPANPLAWLLVLTGTAFEFLAWTTGFGAVLMNTFSRWRSRRQARTTPVTTTT
jgi:hypothetical protein